MTFLGMLSVRSLAIVMWSTTLFFSVLTPTFAMLSVLHIWSAESSNQLDQSEP